MSQTVQQPKLIDRFGRRVTYLRISITDRCDLRCVYCMSEDMQFMPRSEILTHEEIVFIARTFVSLGVHKLRVTGGEPLVRKGAPTLLAQLGALDGLSELVLTTNGIQLKQYAKDLHRAGVKRINVSLDTLQEDRFRALTRVGDLPAVLEGLDAIRKLGFERIKLNAVILRDRNADEVVPLVSFACRQGFDISFIEEMPLGLIDDHDRAEAYYSSDEIFADINAVYPLTALPDSTGGPSRYFSMPGSSVRIGFISPHSHNFCGDCNRVRLTADGRLLLCLGNEHAVDLRAVVREHPGDAERLSAVLHAAMAIKPERHFFNLAEQPVIFRHMSATGG